WQIRPASSTAYSADLSVAPRSRRRCSVVRPVVESALVDSARKGFIVPYGSEVASVPGIDNPARLEAWISQNVPDGRRPGPLTGISLISGGRSNLTYRLDFEVAE